MTDIQNEKDKFQNSPKGNDKPGGGSQVPSRQQGKKIPGGDNNVDIETKDPRKG